MGHLRILSWRHSHDQFSILNDSNNCGNKRAPTSGRLQLLYDVYLDSSSRQLRNQEESEELIQDTWSVSGADPGHLGGPELLVGRPDFETGAEQRLRS